MPTVCFGCGLDNDVDGALEVKIESGGALHCNDNGIGVNHDPATITLAGDQIGVKICPNNPPESICRPNILEVGDCGLIAVPGAHFGRYVGTSNGASSADGDHFSRTINCSDLGLAVDTGLGQYWHRAATTGFFVADCSGVYGFELTTGVLGCSGQMTGGRARLEWNGGALPNVASSEFDDYNHVIDIGRADDGPEFTASGVVWMQAGDYINPNSKAYTAAVTGVNMRAQFLITYFGEIK